MLGVAPIMLASCGNDPSSENEGGNSNSSEITLSSDELNIYNSITGSLTSFKDPGSVTLTWVSEQPLIGGRYVRINAKNSFGGYVTNLYQCNGYSLRSVDSISLSSDPSISISKINQKLSQYKSSMGF